MTIWATPPRLVRQCVETGVLTPHAPRLADPAYRARRLLLVGPQVRHWQQQLRGGRQSGLRNSVEHSFNRFVEGGMIACPSGIQLLTSSAAQPGNVFELRITFDPQQRVLGAFVARDVFVATTADERRRLDARHADGTNGWHRAIEHHAGEWEGLFPSMLRLSGTCLEDYVRNGVRLEKCKLAC